MFKNRSPLGKENMYNEWLTNEPVKSGMSPIKNPNSYFEHSFANVRKGKYVQQDKNLRQLESALIRQA